MKINKALNLVVPVETEEGEIFFHSTPLFFETFKKYHFVICATFTKLLTAEMHLTGAKIAAMTLEEVARDMGKWEGKEGVENGLMNEISRLTNVLILGDNGWESLPVDTAIQREFIEPEYWEEAKQRIVFFMLVCAMTKRDVRDDLLTIMNGSWQTQTTSLTSTEYADSLPILSETETSPKKKKRSSVVA